jgi:hypothetical protein
MLQAHSKRSGRTGAVSHDDLTRIVGDIDQRKALQILALNPTVADLEEAAIWAAGNGDVLGKRGRPLGVVAANIFDILTANEEEPPPAR